MNRTLNLLLSALSVILTIGCVNSPFDTDTVENFDDLNVSSNFNWETSHDVEFLITADHTTVINITSEDGTIQYHKGFYSQLPDAYEVKINLPTYVQRVLVNGVSTSVTGTMVEIPLSS
ncbi:MAG: hypothetical protein PHS30_02175, partial [Bacteroidales bacterium]|nr:hypothetical protein [Bacteroidales bacterium]